MRVLVTRPREQAAGFAEALQSIGAEPVFLPTIAIQPVDDTTALDQAISQLDCYDWLIFTSSNAVDVVLGRMSALGIDAIPENLHIAAIGPRTAASLQEIDATPEFVPTHHISEAILSGMGDLKDRWVLLPLADIADDNLSIAIQNANGIPHVITAYHTIPAEPDPKGIVAIQDGVNIITFTSGSTARNFYTLVRDAGLNPLRLPNEPKIACIGPKTERVVCDLGFSVDIVAEPHTSDGLVTAIQTLINGT